MKYQALREGKPLQRRGYSVRGLANWILDLASEAGRPVTNMALNKLLFFAYERALVEHGLILTDAKIEAWDHGPVFREVYQSFKGAVDRPITTRASFFSPRSGEVEESRVDLAHADAGLLADVLLPLIPLSASRLRELSHVEDGAWHRVWCYDGFANPGMEITTSVILEASRREG